MKKIKKNSKWIVSIAILLAVFTGIINSHLGVAQQQRQKQHPQKQQAFVQQDATYLKFASWNIRIFSNSRTDDELKSICNVARNFDFITVMEVRDTNILQRFMTMLNSQFGRHYAYDVSPVLGEADPDNRAYSEMCAFVYDTAVVHPVTAGRRYEDATFFRKPYYGTFKAGNFDFTVIGIHVIWGDTVEGRRKEIKRLATVYRTIQDGNPNENDVILVGDFNRDPNDDLSWGPLKAISSMTQLFSLPDKSMVWDTHLYDNILFQSCYTTEYSLDKGINRFDETDFSNNDDLASKTVSDHRPVWALFRVNGTDDD